MYSTPGRRCSDLNSKFRRIFHFIGKRSLSQSLMFLLSISIKMGVSKFSLAEYLKVLLTLLVLFSSVSGKAVFAHFMMANSALYDTSDWKNDMKLAQEAHIDAFALNMAYGVKTNQKAVADAFAAAESLKFHLFFSFDYDGNGAWPKMQVAALLKNYSTSSAYYRHHGKPFTSTFEGTSNAEDWVTIKKEIDCFFVPDWSSVKPASALQLAGGVVDGLFSWAAWPAADSRRMNTYADASYIQSLKQANKSYMMPASPWFYTNMPKYKKNWASHGDDLWYDRWVEIAFLEPEWVEIISWNDYGESHYIGPLNEKGYGVFIAGKAPFNYARDMPHDGWRAQLPYVIDLYKAGKASITEESLVVWYRTQPLVSCANGNTSNFTPSQLQTGFDVGTWFADKIFFSALLTSNASVAVSIGGIKNNAKWEYEPDGGVGIYHGSFDFDSKTLGKTVVIISRDDQESMRLQGNPLSTVCSGGLANYNAWVGSSLSGKVIEPVSPKLSLSQEVCIEGFGYSNFTDLCQFTCKYGYCPLGTCYCTAMGKSKKKPRASYEKGEPKHGDTTFTGLCSFACYWGFCPDSYCSGNGTYPAPTATTRPKNSGGQIQIPLLFRHPVMGAFFLVCAGVFGGELWDVLSWL
ncbi:hypothetical protein N7495_007886 [Penicillium taxi]|uniref:uncharacterized protein n=1 Tax=Penicillium taxi TaxID=168475 RepID=UPI00254548F8|nr:uncharacterized protein N7495_007886 [Penicillium taxi]KAJ5887845.1 hypothetical protein N7495_007886 [Penicillium taxi]